MTKPLPYLGEKQSQRVSVEIRNDVYHELRRQHELSGLSMGEITTKALALYLRVEQPVKAAPAAASIKQKPPTVIDLLARKFTVQQIASITGKSYAEIMKQAGQDIDREVEERGGVL